MPTEGPLYGLKVVEFAGIGPGPQAAWQLADMGASLTTIGRPYPQSSVRTERSGRTLLELDLKTPSGRERGLQALDDADILIEGFRPGVMERLGLGPSDCFMRNPGLIYGRMTGWGQEGPLSQRAGHDINYIALTGVLAAIGEAGRRPVPPLNLVGDIGGGTMFLIAGVLAALHHRSKTGNGCVVDASIVDGTLQLSNIIWQLRAQQRWTGSRESNVIDGGAPFYGTYECADGKYVAIGAIEPQFWAELLDVLGLEADSLPDRSDRTVWPALFERLRQCFLTKTRDEWAAIGAVRDACLSPVLEWDEVGRHPHIQARGLLHERDGARLPAASPRFIAPGAPTSN